MSNADFLNAYRSLRQELMMMEHQLAQCGTTGRPSGVHINRYNGMPRGTNDSTAAAIQLQDGMEAIVQDLRDEEADMAPRFQELLGRARNFRDRCILHQYYYLGQTNAEVADCLCVSPRHASRLRESLILHLDNPPKMSDCVIARPVRV